MMCVYWSEGGCHFRYVYDRRGFQWWNGARWINVRRAR